jgi:hypothetical protein
MIEAAGQDSPSHESARQEDEEQVDYLALGFVPIHEFLRSGEVDEHTRRALEDLGELALSAADSELYIYVNKQLPTVEGAAVEYSYLLTKKRL